MSACVIGARSDGGPCDEVHLLMELCKGGELLGRIRPGMEYSESTAADLAGLSIPTHKLSLNSSV